MILNAWSGLIVGLMTLMFLVNAALGLLNLRHQKKPLAANVKNIYSKEKLKKSRDYFGENTRFNLVRSTFSYLLMIALFVGGFFPFVGQLTTQITNNELLQTFLFLSILLILNTIITLPFSYYRTFSIETRYGFNKSTKSKNLSPCICQLRARRLAGQRVSGVSPRLVMLVHRRSILFRLRSHFECFLDGQHVCPQYQFEISVKVSINDLPFSISDLILNTSSVDKLYLLNCHS